MPYSFFRLSVTDCPSPSSTASEGNAHGEGEVSHFNYFTLFTPTTADRSESQDELEPTQVPKASLAASPTPAHHALQPAVRIQNPGLGATLPPSHPFETNAKVNT